MQNRNICKFPTASPFGGSISVSSFVNETNRNVMITKTNLNTHRMILVTEGAGQFLINGTTQSVNHGSLIFVFEWETFSLALGEITYMYIDYSGSRAGELHRRFDITPLTRSFEGFDSLIPLWQESLARASDKTIDLASESILLYTLSRLADSSPKQNEIISRISEITERDFSDPELSIGEIARTLNYHPKYISHLFKEKMGVSYSEYLRSMRLKYAITLLDHGIDSVKNVALLSGFSDPLYFSKVFKENIGVSPKEYIKRKENSGE